MGKSLNDILIRKFIESDMKQTTEIIVESFESKFSSLVNLPKDSLLEFLLDLGAIENRDFEGHYVAEKDGVILGVMTLKWKNQKRNKKKSGIGLIELWKKYGIKNIIKFIIGMSLLSHPVIKEECYIEHIAVSSKARGLGIGSKLLNEAEKRVENNKNLKKLTLHVAGSNKGALRLYKRIGFTELKREESIITNKLLKEKSWIYMEKII